MHVDYPHGVWRPGATDKTSGKPVTTFRLYRYEIAPIAELESSEDPAPMVFLTVHSTARSGSI